VDLLKDELSQEFTEQTGITSDMTNSKWKEVLGILYEFGKKQLKAIKKCKEPFREDVMRTVFKYSTDSMGVDM